VHKHEAAEVIGEDVALQRGLDLFEILEFVLVEFILAHDLHAAVIQVVLNAGGDVDQVDVVGMKGAHVHVRSGCVELLFVHFPLPELALDGGQANLASQDDAVVDGEFHGVLDRHEGAFVLAAALVKSGRDKFELLFGQDADTFIGALFAAGGEAVVFGYAVHGCLAVAIQGLVFGDDRFARGRGRFPQF